LPHLAFTLTGLSLASALQNQTKPGLGLYHWLSRAWPMRDENTAMPCLCALWPASFCLIFGRSLSADGKVCLLFLKNIDILSDSEEPLNFVYVGYALLRNIIRYPSFADASLSLRTTGFVKDERFSPCHFEPA
jgi:hypothetical protein